MTAQEHVDSLMQMMRENEDPSIAASMAKYLKGHFVCYGIKSPVRKTIQKVWFNQLKNNPPNRWDIVYLLWSKPERELHYIAIDYLRKMPKNGFEREDHLKLSELLTTNAWWDSVDSLASNCVGSYFQQFPEMKEDVIKKWRHSTDIWLNRTCLIFQLKYKNEVDAELLKSLILQYREVKEFFIQKAIGWSLRQYSKFQPDFVRAFLEEVELSTLAKREATKKLDYGINKGM